MYTLWIEDSVYMNHHILTYECSLHYLWKPKVNLQCNNSKF